LASSEAVAELTSVVVDTVRTRPARMSSSVKVRDDSLLFSILGLAGVKLGAADVAVTGTRCGGAVLVRSAPPRRRGSR
jgi:uncharacterized membrane protein